MTFESLKENHPVVFEMIMADLERAARAVRSMPYIAECFKEDWERKCMKYFEQLVKEKK